MIPKAVASWFSLMMREGRDQRAEARTEYEMPMLTTGRYGVTVVQQSRAWDTTDTARLATIHTMLRWVLSSSQPSTGENTADTRYTKPGDGDHGI